MAISIIDRLLGRTETALAVVEPPTIEAKAVTGLGAFAMTYHTPLHSLSRDPHKLMAEAQSLFHANGWIGAAERALGGRFIRMQWHLEDENGKTVDEKSPESYQEPLRLLQRPSKDKTRRQVMSVTFRHAGMAGNAIWVLDQTDALAGRPLQVLYVNPARMTPAYDAAGNVAGWVLDHPDNQVVNQHTSQQYRDGVPLTTEEVIHFTLDEPDWGIWGIGIAEAAQRKIELDKLADMHAGGVLSSGGRLSGIVSPKANGGAITDDQWVQFVRDWRSITSDPDAAKRLQIAKMPLDFQQMTANPKDLQLIDVMKQGRDDILAQWGVPLSQLGINVPSGLNADRSEADDAAIWETIKHRSEAMRETIQVKLLDRWEAVGVKVTLVFDYPEFDDNTPQYEAVEKSRYAPLTNDQRRDILGLEPMEDQELGKQVWIDSSLVRIDAVIATVEPAPEVSDEPSPEGQSVGESPDGEAEMVKAKADLTKPLLGLRTRTETTWEPKVRKIVTRVLGEQRKLVLSKTDHTLRKNDLAWWNEKREHRRFMEALDPVLLELATEVANEARKLVPKSEGKADSFLESVIKRIRESVGARITGINQTTREKVQSAVETAVADGLSPAQLGDLLESSAAFDEYRSELIGRTETALVYNDAALSSYGALDVAQVQAIDGDDDAECASRNGKTYPLDEAMGITDHPNGTLDWIPVV